MSQTKVFDGSSVRDCLRPRRAMGWPDVGPVVLLEAAASPFEDTAALSWADTSCATEVLSVDESSAKESILGSDSDTSSDSSVLTAFLAGRRFLAGFDFIEASSEQRRDSGGVRSPGDARSSKSSKLSSLRKSSSSKDIRSKRCRLLLKEAVLSLKRVRSVTNSFSESRSENESNVGRPVSVVPFDESNAFER